ncbi:hypothetical protein [Streptomyces phaeochromogenes]|uniref:hypothetical protein n=1 Tax=Streptomyces phaeochromogenes TaxID=1923 RepID=UPI0006E2AE84|nr:hypothetical protein [Streptomyces phaeochromogenes]
MASLIEPHRWSILTVNGDTAAIEGTGRYEELGAFANLWAVTLDKSGKCTVFRMWNNEIRPARAPANSAPQVREQADLCRDM